MRPRLVLLATALALVPAAAAKLPPPPTQALVVATGRAPCGLASHRAELWVGVYEAGTVLQLDRRGRVRRRLRVGSWACRVAVDDTAVWVTRDRANELVQVDRDSGRIRRVRISSPFDVQVAHGAVWATSFEAGTVTRLDRSSARRTRVYRIGGSPAGLASCLGRLWVGHGGDATWLTSIDPGSGRVERVDVVARAPGRPRCVRGELWVVSEDEVLRVSPDSGLRRERFALGGTLSDVAAARSATGSWAIWVTDKERSLVHRIDPVAGHVVDSFAAGPGAFALARLGSSVWISSFAGADVRRYDP